MTSANKYARRFKENPTAVLQKLGHFSVDLCLCLNSKVCPQAFLFPLLKNTMMQIQSG